MQGVITILPLAEAMLDNAILKDVNSRKWMTPAARWQAVAHVCEVQDVSKRRACTRSTIRYHSRRPDETGVPHQPEIS